MKKHQKKLDKKGHHWENGLEAMWNAKKEVTLKKQDEMIENLIKTLGIVRYACQLTGIHRPIHNYWLKNYPEYAERFALVMEEVKDYVEMKIMEKIKEDDTTMLIFYAKTKMKDRGYVERQEITGKDGLDIVIKEV